MALNGKYVKIDIIMEGLYRDYGFKNEIDWVDAIEWIGECLDLIAAPKQYIRKTTDGNEDLYHPCAVVIEKYRGTLPCDLHQIIDVRENNSKTPMRWATDTFHKDLPKREANLPQQTLTSFGTISFTSDLISPENLLKDFNTNELTFTISNNHIFTNFEEGCVEISYLALPSDSDGYPLIPDNTKFIQACKAYVAEKIGQKLFIQGKMDMQKFNYLQRERDWYVGAATTAGLMPTIPELESWKNQFVRLIPNMNARDTSFQYYGDKPQQRNHNSI